MSLLEFVLFLVVLGIVWFLIDRYLPLPDIIRTVLRIIGVLVVIFLVLSLFGVMKMPFSLTPGGK